MKILQINFFGDHNVGMYGKACDKFCFLSFLVQENIIKKIENLLKVKVYPVSIAKTDFIGILCCLNSNGIVLPKILAEKELEILREIKKELGINLGTIESKFTAVGNLILCNDKGALLSKTFTKKDKKKVEDLLGVNSEYLSVAKIKTLGSCGIATNKGCLIHRDAKEEEIKIIEDVLKVKVDVGTANFGSPFVGSCIIANSNGALIGSSTTGPEFLRISEALGLV
ncbi:MAG: translation initiation factor IF-6 [Candidatus Aenigmatarchaeota archaeon]